ncbi:MAG: energy-coupling factor transporter ATPase [Clostridia bacterium]|nr:energy-coupling factor transporter ATPase [Clostridia bacterium]
MSQIVLKGVSYSYSLGEGRSLKALKNLSFSIEKGEFVTLLGMNGSGKSTLAKLLNGLFIPSEGEILIDGLSTASEKNTFEIRKKVGMVFQNPDNQMVATIIEDDIAFGPENLGLKREEIVKRVDEALKSVGMEEFRERTTQKLSGGQKQRIAIAGVLAMRPDVIIFDESTSMLDPKGRDEIMDIARKLNSEGITIINITHSMEEAALSDRVIVLRKGRIAIDGNPKEVFSSELVDACGLVLPLVTASSKNLIKSGYDFGCAVTSEDEFVEGICKTLSK